MDLVTQKKVVILIGIIVLIIFLMISFAVLYKILSCDGIKLFAGNRKISEFDQLLQDTNDFLNYE